MIGNTLTLFREATDSVDENIATIIVGIAIVVSVQYLLRRVLLDRHKIFFCHKFISYWMLLFTFFLNDPFQK